MLYLTDSIKCSIINHCLRERPHQACGLVSFNKDGESTEVIETINYGAWPYGFQISPEDMLMASIKSKKSGDYIKGVYHCHLASSAQITDRDKYRTVPNGMLYIIVSLINITSPEIRCYEKIDDKFIEIHFSNIVI